MTQPDPWVVGARTQRAWRNPTLQWWGPTREGNRPASRGCEAVHSPGEALHTPAGASHPGGRSTPRGTTSEVAAPEGGHGQAQAGHRVGDRPGEHGRGDGGGRPERQADVLAVGERAGDQEAGREDVEGG